MLHNRLLIFIQQSHDPEAFVFALLLLTKSVNALHKLDLQVQEVHLLEEVFDILILDVEVGVEAHGFGGSPVLSCDSDYA